MRDRVQPQEVSLFTEDVVIDADDFAQFVAQGGSLVVRGSRVLVVNQREGDDEPLAEIDVNPWLRIRQSCGMKYKNAAAITAMSGSSLCFKGVSLRDC